MLLNADLGESFGIWKMGNDEAVMPLIDMANIACGMHASDPFNMNKTIALAKTHRVKIGAHPSYPDLLGFGRKSIAYTSNEIYALILFQIGALDAFCTAHQVSMDYVKPHGALYNDMMEKEHVFEPIVHAIKDYNSNLKIMVLAGKNQEMIQHLTTKYGISIYNEAFLDRGYNDDGSLVKRGQPDALLDQNAMLERVKTLLNGQPLQSINHQPLPATIDCLCVHTDHDESLQTLKVIQEMICEAQNSR